LTKCRDIDILHILHDGRVAQLVILDLSAAFVTVDHLAPYSTVCDVRPFSVSAAQHWTGSDQILCISISTTTFINI